MLSASARNTILYSVLLLLLLLQMSLEYTQYSNVISALFWVDIFFPSVFVIVVFFQVSVENRLNTILCRKIVNKNMNVVFSIGKKRILLTIVKLFATEKNCKFCCLLPLLIRYFVFVRLLFISLCFLGFELKKKLCLLNVDCSFVFQLICVFFSIYLFIFSPLFYLGKEFFLFLKLECGICLFVCYVFLYVCLLILLSWHYNSIVFLQTPQFVCPMYTDTYIYIY